VADEESGVQVRIGTDEPAATADLFTWLRNDAGLIRAAEVRPGPAERGTQGALEIIDVVLGQATAISGLALAVEAWRRSRARPETITITRADGATITLPADADGNAEVIRQFLDHQDGGSAQAAE
jgi:hypothetical protein